MIEPTKADIGRAVIYRAHGTSDPAFVEWGVITTFTKDFVFVRYGSDRHSKGTRREDLEWQPPSNPSPDSIPAS